MAKYLDSYDVKNIPEENRNFISNRYVTANTSEYKHMIR